MARWAAELPSRPTVEQLLALLERPPLYNDITTQHIVMHPASGMMRMWVPSRLLAGATQVPVGTGWVQTLLK
jgi:hypothetical protein